MNEQLRTEFNNRIKSLKLSKGTKEELFLKFKVSFFDKGFLCAYCNKRMELKWGTELSFTIDHIIPRKLQGKDIINNLTFACRTCNFLKGGMSAENYLKNMERLIARKKNNEYWKARRSSKRDEAVREAYKDIFLRRGMRTKRNGGNIKKK